MSVELREVLDLICLVYHEARNVRHPIDAGKLVDAPQFKTLRSLSRKRGVAWQQMTDVRERATDLENIRKARKIFECHFGLSLQDLVVVYEKPIWRHSALGGNKWADITRKVCDLAVAMEAESGQRARELHREILLMCHNTGRVAEKLRALRST